MEAFERQLAVAIICSPKLADKIGGLEEITSLGGSYGEAVRKFIKSVQKLNLSSLVDGEGRFSELLEQSGLGGLGILEEAKRQIAVGRCKT